MLKIQSIGNVIKSRFSKGGEFATAHFGHLTNDIFDGHKSSLEKVEDYLSDVVFEKTGRIFPKIKATFQGKPIATTKKQLFKQLYNLPFDRAYWGDKDVAERINNNIANLENADVQIITSISKLFSELEKKTLEEVFIPHILFNKNCLSTIKNIFTHNRNLSAEEIKSIVNNLGFKSFKHINTLLEISPQRIENYKLGAFIEHSNTIQEEQLTSIINNANLTPSEMIDEVIKQNALNPVKDNTDLVKDIRDRFSISLSDITSRINIVKEKLKRVNDEKIGEFVRGSEIFNSTSDFYKQLKISKNYFIESSGMKELEKNELLLDAYHCKNGDYSMLNGETQEYYKTIKKETPELANKISTELETNMEDLKDSHKRLLETTDAGIFNEAVRLEPVKQFIGRYGKEEPEMVNHLYENYFLTKMEDCELKDKCREINKEFGTKVFVDINTQPNMLDKIKNELQKWRKASGGKAQIPNIFDFSQAKREFVKNGKIYTVAYSRRKDHSINMPAEHFYSKNSLRHEMMHLNDTEFVPQKGSINGIDFDSIKENKTYQEELEAAGIEGYQLEKYAYEDKGEFVAVASTGDTREYSKEFKDILIKLGMPEWVFNLKQLNPPMKVVKALENGFINMTKIEKDGDLGSIFPNGIMITEKGLDLNETAKWLADKSSCNLTKVDFNNTTQEEALSKLSNIADEAKKDPVRTIIQIENFKKFTIPNDENDRFISKLKYFLQKCAKEYKCTVIANVDNPTEIDNYLMASHRFPVIIDLSA